MLMKGVSLVSVALSAPSSGEPVYYDRDRVMHVVNARMPTQLICDWHEGP